VPTAQLSIGWSNEHTAQDYRASAPTSRRVIHDIVQTADQAVDVPAIERSDETRFSRRRI
jgi:hypothetical protein